MDAKITLSFDETVIDKAKRFASKNNISLSRLTEFLYEKITAGNYASLEEFEISDWVAMVAEGPATYTTAKKKSSDSLKKKYLESRK
ncbi:MAG: DUF6364 family protein [Chitinophagaceae bacterium]